MGRAIAAILLLACAQRAPVRGPEPLGVPEAEPANEPPAQDRADPRSPAGEPASGPPVARERAPARPPPLLRRGTEQEVAFCLAETNRYRKAAKKPPFVRTPRLDAYAAEGAEVDARARKAHHHFNTRHYPEPFSAFAENEIPWWHLPDERAVEKVVRAALASMWAEGPGGGHYENLAGDYTEMGCGIWIEGDEITIVQNFRRP
jgi:uncharacterized protein YkwD